MGLAHKEALYQVSSTFTFTFKAKNNHAFCDIWQWNGQFSQQIQHPSIEVKNIELHPA